MKYCVINKYYFYLLKYHSSKSLSAAAVVGAAAAYYSSSYIIKALSCTYICSGSLSPQYIENWRAYCTPYC
jgi:preprotein translocase subunit SecF